jgi:hypothetical protein
MPQSLPKRFGTPSNCCLVTKPQGQTVIREGFINRAGILLRMILWLPFLLFGGGILETFVSSTPLS